MNPQYLHDSCYAACLESPQFRPIPYEAYVGPKNDLGHRCKFGDTPKMGLYKTVEYWRDYPTLWRSGYSDFLPPDVRALFQDIRKTMDQAVKDYCETAEAIRARGKE